MCDRQGENRDWGSAQDEEKKQKEEQEQDTQVMVVTGREETDSEREATLSQNDLKSQKISTETTITHRRRISHTTNNRIEEGSICQPATLSPD